MGEKGSLLENMELEQTKIDGVYIINNTIFEDKRGIFVKTFNKEIFKNYNLCTDFKESYYSISNKNVIRGMHFQYKPFEHDKLVYVVNGKILDVVVDLRKESKTFKEFVCVELNCDNRKSIYIPKGCAHGFLSLQDNSIVVYNVSTTYNKDYDMGIRYDSFGMNWNVNKPIISNRDMNFCEIDDLKHYF